MQTCSDHPGDEIMNKIARPAASIPDDHTLEHGVDPPEGGPKGRADKEAFLRDMGALLAGVGGMSVEVVEFMYEVDPNDHAQDHDFDLTRASTNINNKVPYEIEEAIGMKVGKDSWEAMNTQCPDLRPKRYIALSILQTLPKEKILAFCEEPPDGTNHYIFD